MPHIISKVIIDNFKSIVSESFELSEYTPLVGYNNAGKSNVLLAIKWLLRKSSLGAESFNNSGVPVIVTGVINGIDAPLLANLAANHQAAIQPYLQNGALTIRRIQNVPNDTAANIRLFIYDHQVVAPNDPWRSNPAGIDNALNTLFPEPIHIGAMENSEEDVSKSKTTTTIGKLLGEIIGPIEQQYGAQVNAALAGLRDLLDSEGQNRAPELTQFDTAVNQKIDVFFPDVSIRLHVPTPEIKDVFSKGTVKVYEQAGAGGRDVSALGRGAQRSIQMALVRQLAELRRGNQANTTTLLLIDEPELYLHPQAIEVVRDALKTLSNGGYQVIFSTHSANMITHEDVENAVLVRKSAPRGTHRRVTLKSAVPQVENDAPSQIRLLFSLSNSSHILFSEKVILTEGKTELRLLPHLIAKETGKTLGLHKAALIPQGGVTNTQKCMAVLSVMDLPTKAIVDLDYVLKKGITDGYLAAGDADVAACHTHMATIAPTHAINLGNDGWPSKGGAVSPAAAFALLAADATVQANIESIHQKMLPLHIWVWKKGAIEDHLGLAAKDEQTWANFVNQLKANPFNNVVVDHVGVRDCITWILS